MVLRKITVDNGVRYFPKSEQKKKLNKTQKKIKTKNFEKIIKNLLKILQQEDLEYLNE